MYSDIDIYAAKYLADCNMHQAKLELHSQCVLWPSTEQQKYKQIYVVENKIGLILNRLFSLFHVTRKTKRRLKKIKRNETRRDVTRPNKIKKKKQMTKHRGERRETTTKEEETVKGRGGNR